jgi:hypothetical protein
MAGRAESILTTRKRKSREHRDYSAAITRTRRHPHRAVAHAVWNQAFVGVQGAPASSFPNPPAREPNRMPASRRWALSNSPRADLWSPTTAGQEGASTSVTSRNRAPAANPNATVQHYTK